MFVFVYKMCVSLPTTMFVCVYVCMDRLGAPSGFFAKLVPVVVKNFSDAFPELLSRQEYVQMVRSHTYTHVGKA